MVFQSIDLDRRQGRLSCAFLIGLFVCGLHGCTMDPSDPATTSTDSTDSQQPGTPTDAAPEASGALQLAVQGSVPGLTEGDEPVSLRIAVSGATSGGVTLEAAADDDGLRVSVIDGGDAAAAEVRIEQPIGMAPIQPRTTIVTVSATDARGARGTLEIPLSVDPTSRPDVYLLAGQSNMVGFSGPGSREDDTGEPDEPMDDVLQLNVTGNDASNFANPDAFTDTGRIAVKSPRFVPATHPLHDGFETGIDGKSGTQIGPALSFAQRARSATTAEILLIPAAWSDTGFCSRATNRFDGMGWNAVAPKSAAFAGTLLHDRAIARVNLALQETGGVLRGILWHQGEADSDNPACAAAYADNLATLVGSLRNAIDTDARGRGARGPDAPVPFIVGTMSRGRDSRGDFSEFDTSKQLVDAAHRGIGSVVTFSDFVNNDDLVPPDYPCGEAACVHFGPEAYREMGNRYFEALQRIVTR